MKHLKRFQNNGMTVIKVPDEKVPEYIAAGWSITSKGFYKKIRARVLKDRIIPGKTMKGPVPVTRLISKDHTIYEKLEAEGKI